MQKSRGASVKQFLADRFAPEWKLLSETEQVLSHTDAFAAYEKQFKDWRFALQHQTRDDTGLDEIRAEIVALRKELRIAGYDLSLGQVRLSVQGFRNDDSMAEGFRRVVVCFCDTGTFFHTGSANHVELGTELERTLVRQGLSVNPEYHYLWFRRTSRELVLSGAATEPRSSFARLEDRASANPLKLLSALKKLA